MSFAFRPDDRSVQAGLRRIARAELRDALARLQADGAGETSVHALRKHIKKLRGLLRLVRPVFDGYGPANAALRDAARHMAAQRDADVRLATLRRLAADLPPGTAERALEALLAEAQAGAATLQPDPVIAALTALRVEARGWRIDRAEWAALSPGLTATWRAARAGHKAAGRALSFGGDYAPFHEWRAVIKHHWYQARLLEPVWPAMLAPQIAAAEGLGEVLGTLNDLDVLRLHLTAHPDPAVAALARSGPLAQALDTRQRALAERALGQGTRLLADKPGALARRWGTWWAAWRSGA